jgi:cysteine desulfurase/selenocysteine lyase
MTTNNQDLSSYIGNLAAESFPEFSVPKKPDASNSYETVAVNTYVKPIYTESSKEDYSFPDGVDLNELTAVPKSTISPINSIESVGAISPIVLPNTGVNELHSNSSISSIIHGIDVAAVRHDFPILSEKVDGKDLIWLDNAATTQKPQSVIDRISYFYQHENSNIHRAAHTLAARATDAYEEARNKVAQFLNAPSSDNIVFVRGTTEGINLIANSYGKSFIGKDDEIIVSLLEHHANIVPWQLLCQETGAKLRVIPVDDSGQIILSEYEKLFNSRTKFVSVTNVSNALGTITPIQELISIAHLHGVRILIDGAQSASHIRTDVQALDCDFYVFSGHKIYGPTGIGAIYAKKEVLEQMRPYQGGGNMIQDVTFEKTIYQAPPNKFEAGTGNIADAVGLGAALDYVKKIGIDNIFAYEHYLLEYGTEVLSQVPGLKFVGTAKNRTSVLSFVIDGYTTEEIGNALKEEGIAVRAGHHCAQPILRRFGLEAAVRPSLAFYNTTDELDRLASILKSFVKR